MKPSLFASSRFFAAVAGAALLVAQTQTFGHTVLGRSSQQAGPNVEEATIAHISCNWAGENHKEYLIYVYPRRNNEARAVQPGTFQIIGNYATEEAAAAAVCTTPIPYNFSGQWVMQVGAESSWCKFRGMLTGGESAYDFLGDVDVAADCFDSSGQAVFPPGNVRCHLAQQDQQQWLLNCTATYPAVAPQRPQGLIVTTSNPGAFERDMQFELNKFRRTDRDPRNTIQVNNGPVAGGNIGSWGWQEQR